MGTIYNVFSDHYASLNFPIFLHAYVHLYLSGLIFISPRPRKVGLVYVTNFVVIAVSQ